MNSPLLQVRDLRIGFRKGTRVTEVVRGADFELNLGETLALVGESGSGKTVIAQSLLRLYPSALVAYPEGSIQFDDISILEVNESDMQGIRGNEMGMIFQEPLSSLNPLHTVEKQLCESLQKHQGLTRKQAAPIALDWLEKVELRNPRESMAAYPHQLSGGERQRVMIAMALINHPKLLIADEPTTAMDVSIQEEILDLIMKLQRETGMSILFITHDLGLVERIADRVVVIQDGIIVEQGKVQQIFTNPAHECTKMLLHAMPGQSPVESQADRPILAEFKNLRVHYPVQKGILRRSIAFIRAVDGVDAVIHRGQTLGLVGESGSGKTTLGKALLRLEKSRGQINFDGRDIASLDGKSLRSLRREIQIIFQDPFGSLSPRMTAEKIIGEGLEVHDSCRPDERRALIEEAMEMVGLDPHSSDRYPHQFSGGQRQRIALARVLILKPRLIVLDEPTSSLDRSIQFQVIRLLKELQREYGISYLFISHDMAVIRDLCHHIAVMKDGKIMEYGVASDIFSAPKHPYTRQLLEMAFSRRRF